MRDNLRSLLAVGEVRPGLIRGGENDLPPVINDDGRIPRSRVCERQSEGSRTLKAQFGMNIADHH